MKRILSRVIKKNGINALTRERRKELADEDNDDLLRVGGGYENLAKWELGVRINEDIIKIDGTTRVSLGREIGIHEREIQRCCQFATKYPDIDKK